MSDSEKPFACKEMNCDMTSANEDHLNVHRKRHGITFNFELPAKNTEIALTGDQTPTPTSFFRNCEEVGLFQDLQNVNPFDETFKKAIENSQNGSVRVGSISTGVNEDTLHTPQIFPLLEQSISKAIVIDDDHDLSIANLVELPHLNDDHEVTGETPSKRSESDNLSSFRDRLEKPFLGESRSTSQSGGINEGKLTVKTNLSNVMNSNFLVKERGAGVFSNYVEKDLINSRNINSTQKLREMNRAAQKRFRKKKNMKYDKMTADLKTLKQNNEALKDENSRLKRILVSLYKIVEDLRGANYTNALKSNHARTRSKNPSNLLPKLKPLPLLAPAIKLSNGSNVSVMSGTANCTSQTSNQKSMSVIAAATTQPVLIPVKLINTCPVIPLAPDSSSLRINKMSSSRKS